MPSYNILADADRCSTMYSFHATGNYNLDPDHGDALRFSEYVPLEDPSSSDYITPGYQSYIGDFGLYPKNHKIMRSLLTFPIDFVQTYSMNNQMDNGSPPSITLKIYNATGFNTTGVNGGVCAILVPQYLNFYHLGISTSNLDASTTTGNKMVAAPSSWLAHNTSGHDISSDSDIVPSTGTFIRKTHAQISNSSWIEFVFTDKMVDMVIKNAQKNSYIGIMLVSGFDHDNEFANAHYFDNGDMHRSLYRMYSINKSMYEPFLQIEWTQNPSTKPVVSLEGKSDGNRVDFEDLWRINHIDYKINATKFMGQFPLVDKSIQSATPSLVKLLDIDLSKHRYMAGGFNYPKSNAINGLGESYDSAASIFLNHTDRRPWNVQQSSLFGGDITGDYSYDLKSSVRFNYVANNSGSGSPFLNQAWQLQEGDQGTGSSSTGPVQGPNSGADSYLMCETSAQSATLNDPWGGPTTTMDAYRRAPTQGSTWVLQTYPIAIKVLDGEPVIKMDCHFYGEDIAQVSFKWQFDGMGVVWLDFNMWHFEGDTDAISGNANFYGPSHASWVDGAENAIDTHWTSSLSPWKTIRFDKGTVDSEYPSTLWDYANLAPYLGKEIIMKVEMTVKDGGSATTTFYKADAAIANWILEGTLKDRR